jgi:large subunit ribosomal protein L29
MNAQDMRIKSEAELRVQLTGLLYEQFNMRMQKGSGQMVTPTALRRVRRDIARVRTVLNEKSREGKPA